MVWTGTYCSFAKKECERWYIFIQICFHLFRKSTFYLKREVTFFHPHKVTSEERTLPIHDMTEHDMTEHVEIFWKQYSNSYRLFHPTLTCGYSTLYVKLYILLDKQTNKKNMQTNVPKLSSCANQHSQNLRQATPPSHSGSLDPSRGIIPLRGHIPSTPYLFIRVF